MQRGPYQEWKFKPYSRGRTSKEGEVSKGGIDWFLYREKVLIPLIFPYAAEVKRLNPDKEVFFIDDNVSLYAKALRSCSDMLQDLGIQRVPFWPPNSPDLHPIENSFDYLKDSIDEINPQNGT